MANRLKTTEFIATTNTVTVATGVRRTLTGATQIFIPEKSIVFKSCMLEFVVSSDGTTATSLTTPVLVFKLGTAAESSVTLDNPNTSSGEGEAWIFSRDVTSYFTTNWTGTAMSWYAAFTGTGPSFANHSARVVITYEYEQSTSITQIKTIRIPIESTRTITLNTYQTIGGATAIPAFKGGYLPETDTLVRQVYIVYETQESTPGNNTNYTGTLRIGGATTIDHWRYGCGNLQSSRWTRSYIDITSQALTTSTSLEAISTTNNRFILPGGMVCCTYEFNSTGSTTIYNSLIIGGSDFSGWIGGTTAADQSVWNRDILIQEPDTIQIKESGLGVYSIDSTSYSLRISVTGNTSGQSTYTTYNITAPPVLSGQYSLWHRIDSGGQNGEGITLNRGSNLYKLRFYSGTAQAGWNVSTQMILNYTSGKHSDGVDAHSHTCFQYVSSGSTALRTKITNSVACYIPETYYYLVGYVNYINYNVAGTGTEQVFALSSEILSGDTYIGSVGGWRYLYRDEARASGENTDGTMYSASKNSFLKWYGDPTIDKFDIKLPRRYKLDSGPTNYATIGTFYSYSNITYTLSGTCTYSGGTAASGVTVDIFRINSSGEEEIILSGLITNSIGVFSTTWISNTDIIFAVGYINNNFVGRSNNVTSSQTNLDMIIRYPNSQQGTFNVVLNDSSYTRRVFLVS